MQNSSSVLPSRQVDVLVVGNGPVGATLATLLGRYGVDTLVVDRVADVLQMPRAIALDNEALRILQLAGLGEEAFDRIVIPEVRMYSPLLGRFGCANTRGSLDGHPRLVTFFQPQLEQAMRAQQARQPSVLNLAGLELVDLQQTADYVLAELRDDEGGSHKVRARYLVGADGAGSRVRSLIGQDFKGQTYAEDWLIVDAGERQGKAIDHVEFHCDPQRPAPHMPAPGGRERWEFMLRPGESRERMLEDASIATLLAPWVDARELKIERKAVYRFHARCCERFQHGRVFLVGDAAHITPPFVGQGLVAGLRDAANLAWKLSWVLRHGAGPELLRSYDQERRPHALAMINLAKLMGRLVMPRNRPVALLVHGAMRLARQVPALRRYFEELEIKPKPVFASGLFVMQPGGGRLRPGALLPQGWMRDGVGGVRLSDELLGDRFMLVGLGVDPRAFLRADEIARWRAAGGGFLQLGWRGQAPERETDWAEDLEGALMPLAEQGTLLVVRPDRVVMHRGPAGDASRLFGECLARLAFAPDPVSGSRRSAAPLMGART